MGDQIISNAGSAEPRYVGRQLSESEKGGMSKRREMRIAVWQFVRIMVALEGRRPRAAVYEDWKAAWRELDAELTRLGRADRAAYSDLMMNQEVVLEIGGDKRRREVVAALARIMQDIKRQMRAAASGAEERRGLKFELAELGELHKALNRDSPSLRQSG
jgi:hypothetical protein